MSCLRGLTVPQLLNSNYFFGVFPSLPYAWGPTSEPAGPDAILTDKPKNILKNVNPKNRNWITGVVKEDGLLITAGKIF